CLDSRVVEQLVGEYGVSQIKTNFMLRPPHWNPSGAHRFGARRARAQSRCLMRVLVANIPMPLNRFLVDLNGALSQLAEIVHSSDAFWNMEGHFDVVHLHFPEY